MNAYATTEIRELTAHELDQVIGGRMSEGGVVMPSWGPGLILGTIGAFVGFAIGGLLDWLFD